MVKDKIVILGASGFIGMHLCKKLNDQKFKIIALIRNNDSKNYQKLLKMGVEIIKVGNLFEKKKFKSDFTEVKYLINLAALAHVKNKKYYNENINCEYMNNIEKNIIKNFKNKELKIIHISSAKVSKNIQNNDTEYAKVKKKAEEIIRKNYKNHIILRPPLIYGPNVKANFLYLMKAIQNNFPLPFKKLLKKRSYMYVENLIDAVFFILKFNHFNGKTYEISDDCLITNEKLATIIAKSLGKKVFFFYIKPEIFNYILKIFGKKDIFNKIMKEFIVSNKDFITDTGWKPPYHYTQGIKKTCLWYKRKFRM